MGRSISAIHWGASSCFKTGLNWHHLNTINNRGNSFLLQRGKTFRDAAEKIHLAVVGIICSEKRAVLLELRRDL